jgi:glyoxylase-like metal-dependent hydrolase (beta-lactamase superfamily II)
MSNDARIRVYRRVFAPQEDGLAKMEVDSYVIITKRYVVILDTLLRPEDMQAIMDDIQDEIHSRTLLIVNSHADWDHCWGNSYFTGNKDTPIIAHNYCATRMQSDEAKAGLQEYQNKYSSYFQNVVLISPTITFSDTLTLRGGDLTIELFSAPGHHADHIAAWIPEIRLLLAFDASEKPLPLIGDVDGIPLMYNTLENFIALQPQRVLCAHGKTTDITIVVQNLHYLRETEKRSRTLLATHSPTEDELRHATKLIKYSFDDVVGVPNDLTEADREFYTWAHETNVAYMLKWIMQQQS